MRDICKCSGEKCKVKKECKRFTCKEEQYQSWADFYSLPKNKKGRCGMFLEIKKGSEIQIVNVVVEWDYKKKQLDFYKI